MALKPSKFGLDEEISLAGKPLQVLGRLQFEDADGQVATRYLLAEASGNSQIVEERPAGFALLRAFPPAAKPVTAGNAVMVQGEKYTLGKVRKLKVLGADGRPPGGAPKAALLLSGSFHGAMGELVREMVPGAGAQSYYLLKPLQAGEVLSGAERAARATAERTAVEQVAQAAAEAEGGLAQANPLKYAAGWLAVLLVVGGLVYACTGA